MRNRQTLKPRVKTKLSLRLRQTYFLALGGSALALVTLFGISVFFYGNIGTSKMAEAAGVTLTQFTATVSDSSTVDILWTTQAEDSNAYFTVERSANAYDYEALEDVMGSGTTQTTHNYSLRDLHPFSGVSYYRLRQNNDDGSYNYSAIQSINIETIDTTPADTAHHRGYINNSGSIVKGGNISLITQSQGSTIIQAVNNVASTLSESESSMRIFPNPAISEINLAFTASRQIETHVDIADLTGKLVYSQPTELTEGDNQIKLPVNQLPQGVYLLSFIDENNKQVLKKFVKQ